MKKLTTISTALLIAGLTMFQSSSAIPPPNHITICPSNSKLVIFRWNMLNSIPNHTEYRHCTAPYSNSIDSVHECPQISQGAYSAKCGWDRPAEIILPAPPFAHDRTRK